MAALQATSFTPQELAKFSCLAEILSTWGQKTKLS